MFHMALPFLPYREPKRLRSIAHAAEELVLLNIRAVLVVTDQGLRQTGAVAQLETLLNEKGIRFAVYARTGAKKMIAAIRALNRRMEIPTHLSGIRREDIPKMARFAAAEANPLYPVPKLMDAAELERFYVKAADWSV